MNSFFQNLLTASFHGSIVILVVIFLRLLLKKTPRKFICFLWLLAGLRLLMPFEIQSSLSLQPTPQVTQMQQWRSSVHPVPQEHFPVPSVQQEVHSQEIQLPQQSEAPQTPLSPAPEAPAVEPAKAKVSFAQLVPYLCLGVTACFGLYTIYAYVSLKSRVREATKIRGGWESDRIETAFILGFIRPKIYVPVGLSSTVRKHILAHERTHLEKGDHWFKMIGFLALALHWFNPLVWVAYILMCKDIELACDERVVQFMDLEERKSYSAALLSCSTTHAHFAACPVAFGEVSVKDRIKTVLNYRRPSFWVSLLGVIAILFVAVCLLTNPAQEEAAPAPTVPSPQDQAALQECRDGLDAMLSQDAYALNLIASNKYIVWQVDLARLGGDTLWEYIPSSSPDPTSGRMEYSGKHYAYQSGAWVETEETDTQFESYLSSFRWDLGNAALLSDTTTDGWRNVRFTTTWETDSSTVETATHTYFFTSGGALYSVDVQNAPNVDAQRITLDTRGGFTDRGPEECFQEAAAAITEGAVSAEALSKQAEYDAWGFFFRVDDDRLSDSGSDVYFSQTDIGQGVLSTTDEYWLERKVGNAWEKVTPVNEPQWSDSSQGVARGTSTYGYIDWTPIYGKLSTGTYRMGKHVTCRDESTGYSGSHDFYSEFEIYSVVDSNSPEAAAAVERCYAALDARKNQKSMHWLSVCAEDLTTEKWLDGDNFLEIADRKLASRNPEDITEHDRTILPRIDTTVHYNGVAYGDIREDPSIPASKVLGLGVTDLSPSMRFDRFEDDFNFMFFERSNHQISFPEGVGVVSDEMVRFVTTWKVVGLEFDTATAQLTYRFDENGNLIYMEYLPTYDDHPIPFYIEIYDDTAEEIDAKIQSYTENLYVSSFSWEDAQAKYATDAFNHRDNGFVNTGTVPITSPVEAARLALLEYPNLESYLSLDISHDDSANMWRVTVKSYHDYQATDEYRDIYLDDSGRTHLLVYEGPIDYDETRK